jgi:hypothetical protein
MYSDEPSFGCRKESEAVRKTLARQSRQFNMRNPQFVALFAHLLPEEERVTELRSIPESNSDELMRREELRQLGERQEEELI